jgi:hypothetical protein
MDIAGVAREVEACGHLVGPRTPPPPGTAREVPGQRTEQEGLEERAHDLVELGLHAVLLHRARVGAAVPADRDRHDPERHQLGVARGLQGLGGAEVGRLQPGVLHLERAAEHHHAPARLSACERLGGLLRDGLAILLHLQERGRLRVGAGDDHVRAALPHDRRRLPERLGLGLDERGERGAGAGADLGAPVPLPGQEPDVGDGPARVDAGGLARHAVHPRLLARAPSLERAELRVQAREPDDLAGARHGRGDHRVPASLQVGDQLREERLPGRRREQRVPVERVRRLKEPEQRADPGHALGVEELGLLPADAVPAVHPDRVDHDAERGPGERRVDHGGRGERGEVLLGGGGGRHPARGDAGATRRTAERHHAPDRLAKEGTHPRGRPCVPALTGGDHPTGS